MEPDQWLSLAMICLAGAVSPGPSLLVILDATRRGGRPAGMLAAIGHGLGIFIYAFGAATGLGWLVWDRSYSPYCKGRPRCFCCQLRGGYGARRERRNRRLPSTTRMDRNPSIASCGTA